MEMRRLRNKAIEKNGASVIFFSALLILIVTISCVVMEYFRVTGMMEAINLELERSGNIAVEYAMIDEARGYHLSRITPAIAQEQFDTYFRDRLGLTSDYKKIEDGETVYQIFFDKFEINEDTAQIAMEGRAYIKLLYVSNFVPMKSFPFDVTTQNVNVSD